MYHGRIDGGPVCWGGAGEVAVPFSCRVIMGFFDKEVFEQRSEEGGEGANLWIWGESPLGGDISKGKDLRWECAGHLGTAAGGTGGTML